MAWRRIGDKPLPEPIRNLNVIHMTLLVFNTLIYVFAGAIIRCLRRGGIGSRGLLLLCLIGYVWLWIERQGDIRPHKSPIEGMHDAGGSQISNSTNDSAPIRHKIETRNETEEVTTHINANETVERWTDEARRFWASSRSDRRATGPVSCLSVLMNSPGAAKVAIDYTNKHHRIHFKDDVFTEITKDCAVFTRKRGYFMQPSSSLEEDFPVAFSILFHHHLDTVERLLRAIYRPHNLYCLHLDGKSSHEIYLAALSLTKCLPNVFLTKREKVVYEGYSRLQADINCMSDVLKKNHSWKYYINLASEEYPLKTNKEIVDILRIYNGANDIEGLDKKTIKSRFQTKYVEEIRPNGKTAVRNTRAKKGDPPHGIKIVRGSAYGIFSRGFVGFIINDRRARDLLFWSRDTKTPDEHYWATLHHLKINPHLNTPGGYKGKYTHRRRKQTTFSNAFIQMNIIVCSYKISPKINWGR